MSHPSATPSTPVDTNYNEHVVRHLVLVTIVTHVICVVALLYVNRSLGKLSRDSQQYHHTGENIAEWIENGEIRMVDLIDEGWPHFIGLVYYLIAHELLLIVAINILLSVVGAVLTYRLGMMYFGDVGVARLAGLMVAVFPSLVYYTSLPLKEAAAMVSLLLILWGICRWRTHFRLSGTVAIVAGMLVVTGLRHYLFIVLLPIVGVCLIPLRLYGTTRDIGAGVVITCILAATVIGALYVFPPSYAKYSWSEYFDIEYINGIRVDLNKDKGRLYLDHGDSAYSSSWLENATKILKGIQYFFLSINLSDIRRDRQLAALPELVFFVICLPNLYSGIVRGYRDHAQRVLPLLLMMVPIILVYSSVTTNMGAMFRWRVQVLPMLFLFIVYGASVRKQGAVYSMLRGLAQSQARFSTRLPNSERVSRV